jgi:predicted ATPase
VTYDKYDPGLAFAGLLKDSGAEQGVTEITAGGYKSIAEPQSIEVRPLTILAGANSSGKTSFLQPLLLLKQTLDATYDPGPLLLDGPNVKFTSGDQLLSKVRRGSAADRFEVGIKVGSDHYVKVVLKYERAKGFQIEQTATKRGGRETILRPGMLPSELLEQLAFSPSGAFGVTRNRCFLELAFEMGPGDKGQKAVIPFSITQATFGAYIRALIHVPAWRGNPERVYPVTAVGSAFPGTFEKYTASVVARWQSEQSEEQLRALNHQLAGVGLTWKVDAVRASDTQVELRVGRLPRAAPESSNDLVNIADVGFGVSQTLPVLVALLAAERGQVVYIEQPEIHLHPRAQVRLADVLADAAKRGVRVIAETHSSLLLQAVQTLVAKGQLAPELVKLHWFVRSENDGSTQVRSADLDEQGAYGDWPMDFDDVELRTTGDYLDAVEFRSK